MKEIPWVPMVSLGVVIGVIVMCAALDLGGGAGPTSTYTVESFTADLTIRIQCSGECDLAAMIAEAREAVEK